MKKIDQTRTLVFCALLAAAAMTIGYIESLFPLPLPIPGARIGLANTVVLLALMLFGAKAAAAVLAVKVVLSALLFGTPISMLYAATGGTLALTAMALLGRCKGISPIGQSVAGAVLHNLGQVLMAMRLTATPRLLIYFTPLAFLAMLTGTLSGAAAKASKKLLAPMLRRK